MFRPLDFNFFLNRRSFLSASEYRKKNETDTQSKPPEQFTITDNDFDKTFHDVFPQTLENIKKWPFRQMKTSVFGKRIITLAELLQGSDKRAEVESVLNPVYKSVFKAAASDGQNNETLFREFFQSMLKTETQDRLKIILDQIASDSEEIKLPVKQFLGVLHNQLLSDLIASRSSMFKWTVEKTEKSLTEADQNVLFYVSGYIISAMCKKSRRVGKTNSLKQELLNETLQNFLKTESDSKKTFVKRFSKWTEKVDRGGLKIPSDNFYLFIRECEMCCRDTLDETHLNSGTYSLVTPKEKIMDRYMCKYYIDKLVKGKLSSYVIENCVSLFLSVRGHAAAKKKTRLVSLQEKKSMRGALKEKCGNT